MYSVLLAGLKGEEYSASSHFSNLGHQVTTATDIVEAIAKLADSQVDLVCLQTSSDDRAIDELQQLTGTLPALPVVLVLTQPPAGLVLECWHAGAVDILVPPLSFEIPGCQPAAVRKTVCLRRERTVAARPAHLL